MPEVPTQPIAEPQRWSAANAKDRIAIVTTDFLLDARIRATFQSEPYAMFTVPSFEAHQDEIASAILVVADVRNQHGRKEVVLFREKPDVDWQEVGIIGIIDPDNPFPLDEVRGIDMYIAKDFDHVELRQRARRILVSFQGSA